MEKKIYNEKKYNKNTMIDRSKRRKTSIKQKLKNEMTVNEEIIPKKKNLYKKKIQFSRVFNFFICFGLLIVISVVARLLVKSPEEPFFNIFTTKVANEEIECINIGINTTNVEDDTNVVIRELNLQTNCKLLEVNEDYSITYFAIKEINKISNNEYDIIMNDEIDISNIEETLKTHITNINNVELEGRICKVHLMDSDPYFVYRLQLSLNNDDYEKTKEDNLLTYTKKQNNNFLIKVAEVSTITNINQAVEKYKQEEIDMFLTNNSAVKDLLGKYEYNLYQYNSGKSIFILGNSNSELVAMSEVREVLSCGINRDNIIKQVYSNNASYIDVPYIYATATKKYDIYAAKNILLTNGYTLKNGVYTKIVNGESIKLTLDLLVNNTSNDKIEIAKLIKENLEQIGIGINIISLNAEAMSKRVEAGTYDILLADVYLNEIPDIRYLQEYINVNEDVIKSFENVSNALTIAETVSQVQQMIKDIKNNIPCIGICCENTYVITAKQYSLNNVRYIHVLDEFVLDSIKK